ncbi:DEAD/DEAH box helicase [Bacillus sp. PS06]|uniref:DEAD/DEAH box helicase n=1 Tax=Bacillus sp. PS06 TaxID=2764176 RepID=UPI00177E1A72|nr:DEAD/DEAH box helicase [Bacillus sp. PS06]MBD8070862.1 DEAD/DEAH box helicase [Bacillus sp. PS06]
MVTNWPVLEKMKPFIQDAWTKAGFKEATPIQEKTIPYILEGQDVIAESPTGTGKTLAYLLPILDKIDVEKKEIQAVILASSHELVMQLFGEFQKWSEGSDIYGASFIGGANVKRQLEKIKKKPQIVFGTPGRVLELIKQKKFKMHEVKTLVLDEGDQLLVPEHLQTMKDIIKSTLKDRQIILFSATLTEQAESIVKEMVSEHAKTIRVERTEVNTGSQVDHIYFVAESRDKIEVIAKLSRVEGIRGLVFVRDIGNLSVLSEKLKFKRVPVEVLHSDANKTDRQTALSNFRSGKSNLLLATDVAARGLDIQGITHVVHYDLPKDVTEYTHRSGRTGRLGSSSGTVVSIVSGREVRELKQLARKVNVEVEEKDFFKGQIVEKRSEVAKRSVNKPKKFKTNTKKTRG